MAIFDFFKRSNKQGEERSTLSNPAKWFLEAFGISTSAGVTVSSREALAINAVYVSGKVIGETISSLKFGVFQKDGEMRSQTDDIVGFLLGTSPDPLSGITASDYWKSVATHLVTYGNSYSIIHKDANMRPSKIELVPPWQPTMKEDKDGNIMYFIPNKGAFGVDEILHFKINSWDGKCGVNPISEQRELFGLAKKQGRYAGSIYGEKPPGYITTEQALNKDQLKDVSNFWQSQTNNGGVGGTPVLGYGMKYTVIPLNPTDIEYIKTRELTDENIYAMYRIPPTIAQNYERATFSNAEQQDLVFLKHTILPYIISFEQEINLKLFPVSNRKSKKPLYCKFNMNTILRADFKSRAEGLAIMKDRGIVSKNEWRALEDMNPVDGGDKYYVPLNTAPEDLIEDIFLKESKGKSLQDDTESKGKGLQEDGE